MMSYISNSCDSSNESTSVEASTSGSFNRAATEDTVLDHPHPVQYTSDHSSIYHAVPSSASSASSSAISAYTLPPHMQYYHSHHYLTNNSSPSVDNINGDSSNDLSIPEPSYSALSEKLRKSTPNEFQCSLFCGGKRCKYESGKRWKEEDKALPGLYSHWITEDILAMSRPNTESIVKFNLIDAFKSVNIKSIINLQEPGEHAHCGNGLHASGFSYDPQMFMKENIYFYNFKWKDYTPSDVCSLLDMVKVMAFALTEGRASVELASSSAASSSSPIDAKRGRPSALSAPKGDLSSLNERPLMLFLSPDRPYTVQMKSQIENVYAFAQFFMPLVAIYPTISTSSSSSKHSQNRYIVSKQMNFTLQSVIKRQQILLHGYESRHLKFIPKILYFVCEKLLQLCNKHRTPSQGLKWPLVTSLSHALDELLYSRSRESCCTSSTSSISSSLNSNYQTSPLKIITDFQITNSSEPFTRYFFSSIPSNLIDSNNLLNSTSEMTNGRSLTAIAPFKLSSDTIDKVPATISSSTSACSSHNSFTATEPVIREEEIDEDSDTHSSNFVNITDLKESNVHQISSVASSSDSLNNYTGDSPTSQSPSSDVNFICSPDATSTLSTSSSNQAQQIHSNLITSVDSCNQSMPPVEGDLILTSRRQQVSKILNKSTSVDSHVRVSTSSAHEARLDDDVTMAFDETRNRSDPDEDKEASPSSPDKILNDFTYDKKNIFNESVAKLLNGGAGDDDEIDETRFQEDKVDKYVRVKKLLENASMYVDPRELESGDFIEEESPSFQSLSSSSHLTSGQEYSEILREYEKESTIGMVDNHFVIDCLLKDHRDMNKELTSAVINYQKHLNESIDAWDTLSREINIDILCGLFWSWLENMTEPILNKKSLIYVVLKAERPLEGLGKLDRETRFTLEYLLRFIVRLQGDDHQSKDLLTKKLLATLTHQAIKLNLVTSPHKQAAVNDTGENSTPDTSEIQVANVIPANRLWPEMRRGTNGRIDLFLKNLYSLILC